MDYRKIAEEIYEKSEKGKYCFRSTLLHQTSSGAGRQ